jgi:hypothetical protein
MSDPRWKPSVEELERLIYLHLISCEPRTGKQGAHDAAKAIYANLNPGQSEEYHVEAKQGS